MLKLVNDICNGYLHGTRSRGEEETKIVAEREMELESLEVWNWHIAKSRDNVIDI
jgi:hypothetical protein